MKEINFYLIRHGETEWNQAQKMQGSRNSPLTEKGIFAAKITGQFLSATPFIVAYSSTQQRAIETRNYILSQQPSSMPPVPCVEHSGFCEMDFGLWDGSSIPVLEKDPAFQNYLYFPEKFDPTINHGEHYLDVLLRMKKALQAISHRYSSGNILVVSHGAALRILLHDIKGGNWLSHRDDSISPRISNASISIVNYQQKKPKVMGKFKVTKYNDTTHLSSTLPLPEN